MRELLTIAIARRALPDVLWSLTSNVLAVASGLALVKIVSKLVPANEYGQATLVLGLVALITQFIATPLLSARLRIYFDHLRQGRSAEFSVSLEKVLVKTGLFMALAYLTIAAGYYVSGSATYLHLLIPALLLIFVQPQIAAMFNFLEAHRLFRMLTGAQTLSKVLPVPILAMFLWFAIPGSFSLIAAQGFAFLVVFLIYQTRLRSVQDRAEDALNIAVSPEESVFSNFGWSLYAFGLFSWIISTSDRYLIDHFAAGAAVGVYVINYSFWSLPYHLLNGWIDTFTRPRFYARAAENDWNGVINILKLKISIALGFSVFGTIAIYRYGKSLALLFLSEHYWHSEQLMLLIASAHVFFVVGHTLSTYFLAVKKSNTLWISTFAIAVFNVAANFVLVPRWGIIAAAFVTMLSYAAWSLLLLIGIWVVSRQSSTALAAKA